MCGNVGAGDVGDVVAASRLDDVVKEPLSAKARDGGVGQSR